MTLGLVVERNARLWPDQTALIYEGRSIAYGEFGSLVRRTANALRALGIKPSDRVAILAKNSPEYLALYLAAGLVGCIAVGINYRLNVAEQSDIIADSEPQLFLFENEYADRLEILTKSLKSSVPTLNLGERLINIQSWDEKLAQASDGAPECAGSPVDPALMIYTSGTTGKPKGVLLSNMAMVEMAREYALAQGARPTDRMIIVMPFYHIGGTGQLLAYLIVGATIILSRAFDAEQMLNSIQTHRATAALFAPTMIQMMLDIQEHAPRDVSSLKTVCYASAPMSVALSQRARAAFGEIFLQVYGMTEQAVGTVLHKHQHFATGTKEQVGRLASAGQAFLNTEIKIVRDDGSECATDESGEICTRSKALMLGYWRRTEATSEAIGDGWMHTGDIGYLDKEQYLFVQDRKKDMIISGGENIYSREVEEALLMHPAVLETAVIGVPDAKWGETVKALIVFRAGASSTSDELIAHCREFIAGYKCPRSIDVLEILPRIASTNKVDKRALRAPYWPSTGKQI